jgi:hypothetical protein
MAPVMRRRYQRIILKQKGVIMSNETNHKKLIPYLITDFKTKNKKDTQNVHTENNTIINIMSIINLEPKHTVRESLMAKKQNLMLLSFKYGRLLY